MLNPYLTFNGNTRAVFDFYREVFGGDFESYETFGNAPAEMNIDAAHHDKIMHVSLPIGDSVLMGSDYVPGCGPPLVEGNNFSISITPGDRAEADRLFGQLAEDGQIGMPLGETFWGAYFGMTRDKFGVNWMLNLPLQQS